MIQEEDYPFNNENLSKDDQQQHHQEGEEEEDEEGVLQQQQQQDYEGAFITMNMNKYQEYFDKINKVLEQSNQLTSSMFSEQEGYQMNVDLNHHQNYAEEYQEQQLIDEAQKKALEYQLFYGNQNPDSYDLEVDHTNQQSFSQSSSNSENQFLQNRFDHLSQEISNRIQERAQVTVTDQGNQFDLHTIEEEDINEEDLSIDKKQRRNQSSEIQIHNNHQESIQSHKKEQQLSSEQEHMIVLQNTPEQVDEDKEVYEDYVERQDIPHPIPQEQEPKQPLIVVKGNRYHIQHFENQGVQQMNMQILSKENFYQQAANQLRVEHIDGHEYQESQQQEQYLDHEGQEQQEGHEEEQQNYQHQEQVQDDEEEELHVQQDFIDNMQNVEENDELECNESEENGFDTEIRLQQEALQAFLLKQSNHQLAEKQLQTANKAAHLQYTLEDIQNQKDVYQEQVQNHRNDQLYTNSKGLTIQDLRQKVQPQQPAGYSQMNHFSKQNLLPSHSDRGQGAPGGTFSQLKQTMSSTTQQFKKKINNFVNQPLQLHNPSSGTASNVTSTKSMNKKNTQQADYLNSLQKKKNGMNSYYLQQDSLSPQQYLHSSSPKEYQSSYSQNQGSHSSYQNQNLQSYYQQKPALQQNDLSQRHAVENSKFSTLNQLQQEKLRMEKIKYHKVIKEQQEEKEKKNLRQSRLNKDYSSSQNSHNQISTSMSNQNEYFPISSKQNHNGVISNNNFYNGQAYNNTSNSNSYYDDQNSNSQNSNTYLNSFKMKKKQMSLSNLNHQPENIPYTQNAYNNGQKILTQETKRHSEKIKSPTNWRTDAKSPSRTALNKDQIMNYYPSSAKDIRVKKALQEKNQQPVVDINVVKKITHDIAAKQAQKGNKEVDLNAKREARNGQVADAINRMVLKGERSQRSTSSSRTPSKKHGGQVSSKIISQKAKEQEMLRYQFATVENTDNLKPKKTGKQQKNISNNYFANYFNESPIKKQSTPSKYATKDHASDRGILSILENFSKKNAGNYKDIKYYTNNQSLTSRNQLTNKNSSNSSHSSVQLKTLIL